MEAPAVGFCDTYIPNSHKVNNTAAGVATTNTAFNSILLTFPFYYNYSGKYIMW